MTEWEWEVALRHLDDLIILREEIAWLRAELAAERSRSLDPVFSRIQAARPPHRME